MRMNIKKENEKPKCGRQARKEHNWKNQNKEEEEGKKP